MDGTTKLATTMVRAALVVAAMITGAVAQGPPGGLPDAASDVARRATGQGGGPPDQNPGNGNVPGFVEELMGGGGQGAGGSTTAATEQEEALRAVRTGQALPLAEILPIAQSTYEGEVIDVHLMRVRSILLYQLTFLAPDGEVFDTFLYAATGIPVQPRN